MTDLEQKASNLIDHITADVVDQIVGAHPEISTLFIDSAKITALTVAALAAVRERALEEAALVVEEASLLFPFSQGEREMTLAAREIRKLKMSDNQND